MGSALKQIPFIPLLVCACGWLFGQGTYEMVRPVVLDNVESGLNRVISHVNYGAEQQFNQHGLTKRDSAVGPIRNTIGSKAKLMEV